MPNSAWQRVSRRRPCPVCAKPDWCLFSGDPQNPDAVICARLESPKRCGQAGWLHVLNPRGPAWPPWRRRIGAAVKMLNGSSNGRPDFSAMAAQYQPTVKAEALNRLAVSLGVTAASLRRLGIGWAADRRAWAFPMSDSAGDILGLRLRLAGGRKLTIKGGHEGLFLPDNLDVAGGPLLIAEGPTDTAALLDLGFAVVGRPSCTGGGKLLVELVGRLAPTDVIIVADGDPPGQRGADHLAGELLAYCRQVRLITPPAPFKDARAWRQGGATAADVLAAIAAAPIRTLPIRGTVHNKKAATHGRR